MDRFENMDRIGKEHIPITDTVQYHNAQVKILEIEHGINNLADFRRNPDWKLHLDDAITNKDAGDLFLQYCIPDIEAHAFAEAGEIARSRASNQGITDFFGHITKSAGSVGKSVFATDTANTVWYEVLDRLSSGKIQTEQILRDYSERFLKPLGIKDFGYQYNNILPGEDQIHTSNDGRHLITARGIMQHILTTKNNCTAFWSPFHQERIVRYFKRQIEVEKESREIIHPVDFKDVSPKEESMKMIFYGRPPLMRSVREYEPTFHTAAYKIDLVANDKKTKPDYLFNLIEKYLQVKPASEEEQHHQELLTSISETTSIEDAQSRINTNKHGWRLKNENYIY